MSIGGDSIYREIILEHYKNPSNKGTLDPNDFTYEDVNPLCGDEIRIDVRVEADRVSDIKFSGRGCAISQASASLLTDQVRGKTVAQLGEIGQEQVLDELGIEISPARLKCALLSLETLQGALERVPSAAQSPEALA